MLEVEKMEKTKKHPQKSIHFIQMVSFIFERGVEAFRIKELKKQSGI